jgi:hypothetical protein
MLFDDGLANRGGLNRNDAELRKGGPWKSRLHKHAEVRQVAGRHAVEVLGSPFLVARTQMLKSLTVLKALHFSRGILMFCDQKQVDVLEGLEGVDGLEGLGTARHTRFGFWIAQLRGWKTAATLMIQVESLKMRIVSCKR